MEHNKPKFVRFYSNLEKNDGNKKKGIEFPLPIFKMGTKLESESKVDSSQEQKNKRILNPESERILRWNRVFLFSCLTALFVDPLFFYLPSVIHHNRSSCMTTDFNLGIVVTVFRTFADVFYLLHMILKFRIAYVSPTSRVFGKGELVTDPKKIAERYLKSDFCIDLIASLPLPQILGAAWYLLSVERHAMCWKFTCRREFSPMKCLLDYLDCGTLNDVDRRIWEVNTTVFSQCSPDEDVVFNYGIFADAITKNVISSRFLQKYFYCLWWGLQNLSSYGQSLETSIYIGETLFAILIAIMGLVLFAHLIGNMQTYLQSITVRLEEWRVKRRDTEEWMKHRQLPQDLQERVRRFVQYKWLATRGVDEESILQGLPTDLRRDIQRHLCLDLVRRVPFFAQMDDQLLDAICERLASSLCTQRTYIVREGDPVTEMLFIIRGMLESSTTDGGRLGFFNSITLRPGDFCGEELLAWALLPKSSISLPSSTRTVRAITEVEAFALRAEDLKFVANQFRRLHSKKLQHTFRFYSYHWRTWAACFIQAAWRRFKRRVIAKSLSLQESFSLTPEKPVADEAEQGEEGHNTPRSSYSQAKQNLGVTILASRFAANTRRGAQKLKDVNLSKLRKPDEPDFSEEPDD
ncbi:putative cyclic nucleotide-gated ion channel 14 isoform X2 [Cucumis melo var. makuwa]|uniref:Putative cyclic nucleotide-gated ion channel 14 isoform X2 n=1 Tax=Cucumis melo var. makuwa TaxID=1194695 RepID=A0A5D3E720_CUCMM|nr:putative cyclic nucleotide-gated ion channel 14 isoform X2 [Cucumis melo var. makuwa]